MRTYISKMYDTIDLIVYDYYGDTLNRILEYVIEQNPGIEQHGFILPMGTIVKLPPRPNSSTPAPQIIPQIRLFN